MRLVIARSMSVHPAGSRPFDGHKMVALPPGEYSLHEAKPFRDDLSPPMVVAGSRMAGAWVAKSWLMAEANYCTWIFLGQ